MQVSLALKNLTPIRARYSNIPSSARNRRLRQHHDSSRRGNKKKTRSNKRSVKKGVAPRSVRYEDSGTVIARPDEPPLTVPCLNPRPGYAVPLLTRVNINRSLVT